MTDQINILIKTLLQSSENAVKLYAANSKTFLDEMPEYFLQSYFLCQSLENKYFITMETPAAELFKLYHGSPYATQTQLFDMVLYDRRESDNKVVAIVEWKKGWVDFWDDLPRARDTLEALLNKQSSTLAASCGVVPKIWYDNRFPALLDEFKNDDFLHVAGEEFEIYLRDEKRSEVYRALILYKIITAAA